MFNKLFIKKPLWVLGLAAAAIFAVTFVACSSDSDDPPAPTYTENASLHEGDAVLWVAIEGGGGENQWRLAEEGKVLDPSKAGYYYAIGEGSTHIEKTDTRLVKVATADKITYGSATGATTVYHVEKIAGSGTYKEYYKGSGTADITATGAKVDDVLLVYPATGAIIVANDGGLVAAETSAGAQYKVAEVTVLQTTGTATTGYTQSS